MKYKYTIGFILLAPLLCLAVTLEVHAGQLATALFSAAFGFALGSIGALLDIRSQRAKGDE